MGMQDQIGEVIDLMNVDVLEYDEGDVVLNSDDGLNAHEHPSARKTLEYYLEKKRLRQQLTEVLA